MRFLKKKDTSCDWKVFFFIFKVIWRFFLSLAYGSPVKVSVGLWVLFLYIKSKSNDHLTTFHKFTRRSWLNTAWGLTKCKLYLISYTHTSKHQRESKKYFQLHFTLLSFFHFQCYLVLVERYILQISHFVYST